MKRYFSIFVIALCTLTVFNACSDVPAPYKIPGEEGPGTGGSSEGTYIDETFKEDFGGFTDYTEKGNPWIIDFKTAKATGYDNASKTTTESKGWLISEAFDLSQSTGAYVEFEYILRYVRAGQTENKVLISTEYFGDVNAAKWIDITGTLTEGSDWDTFYKYTKDLPAEVIGKNHVNIALYYACTTTSATWEVKNVVVKEGVSDNNDNEDEEETETTEGYFSESFDKSLGNFTIKNVKEATGLDGEVWQHSSQYTCAKATSYTGGTGGQNIPTESWLISPTIDLSTATNPVLAFEHASNYFTNVSNDVTVWITNASAEEWIKLDVPTYPTSFTFVNSGDIDLTSYVGKSVKIGFKYVCESKAGTYELRNFVVKERIEEETPDTPSTPSTPATPVEGNLLENGDAETWSGSQLVNWVSSSSAGNGTFAKSSDAHTGNSSICIKGSSKNTRLAYKETIFKAGTYTFKFYTKAATSASGSVRPGYVPIKDDGTADSNNYKYGNYTNDLSDTEWIEVTHEFTLSQDTKLCLVIMNSKLPGKDVLIDDISLTTNNGGIAN